MRETLNAYSLRFAVLDGHRLERLWTRARASIRRWSDLAFSARDIFCERGKLTANPGTRFLRDCF